MALWVSQQVQGESNREAAKLLEEAEAGERLRQKRERRQVSMEEWAIDPSDDGLDSL